jgi:hypothetical protein
MEFQRLTILPTTVASDLYAYLQYIREKRSINELDCEHESNQAALQAVQSQIRRLKELEEAIEAEFDRRIRCAKVQGN